jgi:F-type H+-transporting ATPase subunit delta
MQDNTTLARPYAKAAFEYALQHRQLSAWAELLQFAGVIVQDRHMADLLIDPRYTSAQALQVVVDLCDTQLVDAQRSDAQHNFLRLLADNKRLAVLPEIETLFLQLQAEYEQTLQVHVTSVVALTKEQQTTLLQALERRLSKKVILNFHLDPYLLGGLSIRAGDKVIDLTLLGQLQQLNSKLRTA